MAKRKAAPNQDVIVDVPFPLEGLDETRAFMRQRPGTTVSSQNVRTFDPLTGRARGGSRPGIGKFLANQVNGSNPIQDLNYLTTSLVTPPAPGTYGSFAYSQGSGNGFGIALNGSSTFSGLGIAGGYQVACTCWDQSGNLYVAEVNTGTGGVNLYKVNSAGSVVWNVALGGVALGSVRNVAGICWVPSTPDVLYIARVLISGNTRGVSQHTITKVLASSGAVITNAWQISGQYKNLILSTFDLFFSSASINCLGACGTVLGIECVGSAGNSTQTFYQFDGTLAAQQAYLTKTPWTGTTFNANSKVVSDGGAYFYVIASVTTSQLGKVGLNGVSQWPGQVNTSDTVNSVCYDAVTQQLITVSNAAPSVRSINVATGASASTPSLGSTIWNEIDSDGQGNFVLWKNSVASNDVEGLNSTLAVNWGPSTLANAVHSGCSVNKGGSAQTPVVTVPRLIRGTAIAGGSFYTFTPTSGPTSVTGGTVFNPSAPVIYSAQNGLNMFMCDGVGYWYYKTQTNTVLQWKATTSGTIPVDTPSGTARLIATWRGRTVLGGMRYQGQNIFMSAQNDPFNWNFFPATQTTTQAWAGNGGLGGTTGDFVSSLCPYSDDTFILFCDQSIWQMTGDPMAGGQFDRVSPTIGSAWGRPWAIDPSGQIYFFGSRCGIFKMTPGALPVRVSQQIERRIENIDLSQNLITMNWDVRMQGLNVWVTPLNSATATANFFYEERTNAWQVDVFANTLYNPLTVKVFDGDNPNNRVVLLGGQDGYIRNISPSNNLLTTDDGTPISSFVLIGPIQTNELDEMRLKSLHATLGASSGSVTWQIYVGNSAEAALASSPVRTGTWSAGRNHTDPIGWSGTDIYIKLSSTNQWALERIVASYRSQGLVRQRA